MKTGKIKMMHNTATINFKQAFDEFMLSCKSKNLAEKTQKNYIFQFKQFCSFVNEDDAVCMVDRLLIERYMRHLQSYLSNVVSVNTALRNLRAMVYWWVEQNYCQPVKIKLLKAPEKIKDVYTEEELKQLLKKPDTKRCTFTEYRTWVVINFLISTGCRVGTLVRLQNKDIDFQGHQVIIQGEITKTGMVQVLPLPDGMLVILKDFMKVRGGSPTDALFSSETGSQLLATSINHDVADYNRSRGVEKTGVHLFRHTFAKNFILDGGDVYRLQRQLGHSTLEMSKLYANIWNTDLQKDFEKYNLFEKMAQPQQKKIRMGR